MDTTESQQFTLWPDVYMPSTTQHCYISQTQSLFDAYQLRPVLQDLTTTFGLKDRVAPWKGRYFWSSLSKVVSVKRISCATYGSITYHKMLTGNREAEVLVQRQDFWDSQVQEDMPITLGRRLHGTEREATSHV